MSYLMTAREGRVLRLTLNNPEKRNALDRAACRELAAALSEAAGDQSVGCVLLDAAGTVFSSGLDMEELLEPGGPETDELHEQLFAFGAGYRKPVVAAVQGAALGAGLGLIANCHVTVAAQGTQFGLTEIRVGYWPFAAFGALTRAMGERRTLELSLTGRIFGTNDAQAYGLIHEVTPAVELDDRAWALARHLAYSSPAAIRLGLECGWGADAAECAGRARRTADFREGVQALKEKRKPEWLPGVL